MHAVCGVLLEHASFCITYIFSLPCAALLFADADAQYC
jgi:hypothetical protein